MLSMFFQSSKPYFRALCHPIFATKLGPILWSSRDLNVELSRSHRAFVSQTRAHCNSSRNIPRSLQFAQGASCELWKSCLAFGIAASGRRTAARFASCQSYPKTEVFLGKIQVRRYVFFSAADLSSVYWQFEVSPIESVMLPEKFG